MIQNYPKEQIKQISPHFSTLEFECHCGHCSETPIDDELIAKLEDMREALRKPLAITSGYRCHAYQQELKARGYETAVGVSQHELGRAADLVCPDLTGEELARTARACGFKAVGTGRKFIHVDLRADKERAWNYSY